MFHVFTNSMRTSTRQPSSSAKVDTETIDLLRELGYQLLDEKNDKSKLLRGFEITKMANQPVGNSHLEVCRRATLQFDAAI